MPLVEFVVLPAFIDVSQHFIVEHDRTFLVVAARKKLNHLPPVFFVFGFEIPFTTFV